MVGRLVVTILLSISLSALSVTAHASEAEWTRTKNGYFQLFSSAFSGSGIRFNNPYRLATPLGTDAQSLSRTAAYVDLGVGATFGDPVGLQHGVALRTSFAVEGIKQTVMVPSYLIWRRWRDFALFGRAGLCSVLQPETTFGFEASGGVVWFVRGGLGVSGELVGDMVYGASTRESKRPVYPIVSAQLGLWVAFEVLP